MPYDPVTGEWTGEGPDPRTTVVNAARAVPIQSPSAKKRPVLTPQQRQRRNARVIAVGIGAIVVVALIVANQHSKPQAPGTGSPSDKARAKVALDAFFTQLKRDASYCSAATVDAQISLGEILLAKPPTSGQFVQAAIVGNNGQAACNSNSNNNTNNLSLDTPPSGYPSLDSFAGLPGVWATDEDVALNAFTKLMDSNGNSTAALANFTTAYRTADGDAQLIESELIEAAHKAGIARFRGIGLPMWGRHG
jgi:hypothetical protein